MFDPELPWIADFMNFKAIGDYSCKTFTPRTEYVAVRWGQVEALTFYDSSDCTGAKTTLKPDLRNHKEPGIICTPLNMNSGSFKRSGGTHPALEKCKERVQHDDIKSRDTIEFRSQDVQDPGKITWYTDHACTKAHGHDLVSPGTSNTNCAWKEFFARPRSYRTLLLKYSS